MKLGEFIVEQKKRLALFEAHWRLMMESEEISDGDEVWPEEMDPGMWDESLDFFDAQDANKVGLTVDDGPDGLPVVTRSEPSGVIEPS